MPVIGVLSSGSLESDASRLIPFDGETEGQITVTLAWPDAPALAAFRPGFQNDTPPSYANSGAIAQDPR